MKRPDLPPDTDTHYFYLKPIYERFKTVKVKDYCECCGHKTGTHDEQRGVHLLRYEVTKEKKDMWYQLNKMIIKQVENRLFAPTLWDKFKDKGETIKVPKLP